MKITETSVRFPYPQAGRWFSLQLGYKFK